MRILQILLVVFLALYAINIFVNRPSAPRHIIIDRSVDIDTGAYEHIDVQLNP